MVDYQLNEKKTKKNTKTSFITMICISVFLFNYLFLLFFFVIEIFKTECENWETKIPFSQIYKST